MTNDPPGGGGSGTYWYGVSIEDMWRWVNRDLDPHYQQATSWKKASELTGLYQERLQTFRDRLAQAWNPKTSPAADAYLTKLDELIKAVKDVNDVSARNYQASVDIPNAIAEARYKLEPIYQAYQQGSPQAKSAQFDQAAGVMYQLSADLSKAQAGLGKPAPYLPPQVDNGTGPSGGGGGAGGAPPPPFIPPVVPSSPPYDPAPPKGPDLSGMQPPPQSPPSSPPPSSPPGGVGEAPGPFGPPPGGPAHTGYPPGGVIEPPWVPGGIRPGGQLGTSPTRVGLPGGIIGGSTPGGRGMSRGAVRPNPVGGMIGGGSTGPGGRGSGLAGRNAKGTGRGVIGPVGAGGRQSDEDDGEQFDPDTLWDVAEGVAPVVDSPESQGPVDPGPAIGLPQ